QITMRWFDRRMMVTAAVLCVQVLLFVPGTAAAQGNEAGSAYSFVYLGDLHFDKRSHHDMEWVKANQPADIRQIDDYVRITQEHTPGLFTRVQTAIESSDGKIKMVVQGGDLTEGLCGRRELQELQFKEAIDSIRSHIPQTPFLCTKGNHDITGPGAREAFDRVMLPWLSKECGKPVDSASFYFLKGPDLFVFFDAYHNNNLDWLEKTLKENSHRHAFVVMHPPAVPYGARSTWHLFSREKERDVRERFMDILGANRVVLLTAHLHKYSVLVRRTSTGAFVQLSMSSVISAPDVSVRDYLEGVKSYGSALVDTEPEFQPETRDQRQKSLEAEKPHITRFEYADFPGYAILRVSEARISADIYLGDSGKLWKSVPLGPVLGD
ncbi:MAG TPA: metallophosphoesterase, partial [Candidatus Paceibacterota bacterium]|nr:metallophosphoesterase [Candidatus Paceibacterota bacterium]